MASNLQSSSSAQFANLAKHLPEISLRKRSISCSILLISLSKRSLIELNSWSMMEFSVLKTGTLRSGFAILCLYSVDWSVNAIERRERIGERLIDDTRTSNLESDKVQNCWAIQRRWWVGRIDQPKSIGQSHSLYYSVTEDRDLSVNEHRSLSKYPISQPQTLFNYKLTKISDWITGLVTRRVTRYLLGSLFAWLQLSN